MDILEGVGLDPDNWRLDVAPHPFAQQIAGDVRITTRYDIHDFGGAYFGALHEFGHGFYEAGIPDHLSRTPLRDAGLARRARVPEPAVGEPGRAQPRVLRLGAPRLAAQLPGGLNGTTVDELYQGVNTVHRTLIRTEADETTYNLHVVLRFELELALMDGRLAVDDVPHAWNEGMHCLLGIDVPDDAHGALQDVHWGAGLIGYFPTYTLGNLMAAHLWEALRAELPDVDAQIERGDFGPLQAWLRERVHAHGRKPAGRAPRPDDRAGARRRPFMRYLQGELADAGRAQEQRLVEEARRDALVLGRELVDRVRVLRPGQVPVLDRAARLRRSAH